MSVTGGEPLWQRFGLLELAGSAAVFAAGSWTAAVLIGGLNPRDWLPRCGMPVCLTSATFWLAMLHVRGRAEPGATAGSIQRLLTACGAIFIVQAAALYFLGIKPADPSATLLSILVLVAIFGLVERHSFQQVPHGRRGVLFLGLDRESEAMARSMGPGAIGVLHADRSVVPRDLLYLGEPGRLAEVAAALQPARIVIAGGRGDDLPVSPRLLLDLRLSGTAIDNGLASYEEVFGRVFWRRMQASPLQFLPRLQAQSLVMSVQAVYTNLLGLALLALSLPLLIPASLAVRLFSGPGPVLERVECLGFQVIPFGVLRFRTRRKNGKRTAVGRVLERLRLVDLPQLINVVRGEMAFIGPPPVRKEFGLRLSQLLGFYSARFTVKPGMLGWSQVSLQHTDPPVDESVRLEYDLYYVQEVVPALDMEILIRSIFRRPFLRQGREMQEPSGVV